MSAYSQNKVKADTYLQLRVSTDLIERIDEWGVGDGKTSRSEATRHLIEKGLEAETKKAPVL